MPEHMPKAGPDEVESTPGPTGSGGQELTEDELSRVSGGQLQTDSSALAARTPLQISKVPGPPAPFAPSPLPNLRD